MQGDWGVKYSLPHKLTARTSTPLVRILKVDTPEAVSDFETAADHSLTLEKFQEMNITLKLPDMSKPSFAYSGPQKSAFIRDHDFTELPRSMHKARELVDKRWSFRGPWLSSLSEEDFERFMQAKTTSLQARKRFRTYLRRAILQAYLKEWERAQTDRGQRRPDFSNQRAVKTEHPDEYLSPTEHPDQPLNSADQPDQDTSPARRPVRMPGLRKSLSSSELDAYIRHLRTRDIGKLCQHVMHFLDLPPYRPAWAGSLDSNIVWSVSPFADKGPPPCHPSAGISYLQSSTFVENHRVFGPMAAHAALQARVVLPSKKPTLPTRLGVGGFIVDSPKSLYLALPPSLTESLFHSKTPGGAKLWVLADTAIIRPSGHVDLQVAMASEPNQLIERDMRGEDISEELKRLTAPEKTIRRGLLSAYRNRAVSFYSPGNHSPGNQTAIRNANKFR